MLSGGKKGYVCIRWGEKSMDMLSRSVSSLQVFFGRQVVNMLSNLQKYLYPFIQQFHF